MTSPTQGHAMTCHPMRLAVAAALLALLACHGDTVTSPQERAPGELHLLHVTYDYPPLAATRVSFWAVKGKPAGADLWYRARAGATDSTKFVEFRMQPGALDRRPDGSSIATGDSVLITLTAIDAAHMMIQYEPSGLRFSPSAQPTLRMSWAACGDDVNYDGKVDAADVAIASQLGIWRQETKDAPWQLLPSLVSLAARAVDTQVPGFTGYALAY